MSGNRQLVAVAAILIVGVCTARRISAQDDFRAMGEQQPDTGQTTASLFSDHAVKENGGYVGKIDSCCGASPWSFTLTQSVGFGTSLALPITLTPANTVVQSTGGGGGGAGGGGGLIGVGADILGIGVNVVLFPGNAPPANRLAVGAFEDDFEFLTDVGLQRQFAIDEMTTFTAGAGYYQNLHPQVEQLDLQVPSASAQLARQIGDRRTATLDYGYSYYFLSGSTFLTQHRVDLTLSTRINDCWDIEVGGGYANVDFRRSSFLDSDNYSAQIELIRYLDCQRSEYLTMGYGYGHSNAAFEGFSYDVHNVFVGGRWHPAGNAWCQLAVTASYGNYDFLGFDPFEPGGIARDDDIFSANATLTRPLSEMWSAFASYTYLNSESNVVRQFYHSNSVAVGVTYTR